MSNFWLNQYFPSVHQGSLSIVFFLSISTVPYFIEAVFSSSDISQVNMMDIFPPSLLPLKMWPRLTHILFDKLANYLCQENIMSTIMWYWQYKWGTNSHYSKQLFCFKGKRRGFFMRFKRSKGRGILLWNPKSENKEILEN